ncbi:anti-sigma factor antagonist [Geodermatophilus sp. DF01-2]|uniref:STAS domain-containing protein n=1 Tax=Geodermatophilus sp. DF01-2 TaxID=2559610 RepID=UPI0010734E17|nr:STAS domain-containing protein [Geodermatophilus sp. DF01_2]TFV57131.1 anti-sigma factor antagonist [Geodermatophilus sp. DF01_2]
MDDTSASRAQGEPDGHRRGDVEPEVTTALDGDVPTLTVAGELTEGARRPLVRTMTDLLLDRPDLRQVRLDLRAVSYVNSAGMAVLVQLQKLGQPRGVDVVLVAPPSAVSRPLQLSGLWLRFPVEENPGVQSGEERPRES